MQLVKDRRLPYETPAPERYSAEEKFCFDFDVYREGGAGFDYSDPGYPKQSLYLSQDTTRLLEIVFEKGMAKVWRRDPHPGEAELRAGGADGGRGAPAAPRHVTFTVHAVIPAYP
jgi:hypothetical protein